MNLKLPTARKAELRAEIDRLRDRLSLAADQGDLEGILRYARAAQAKAWQLADPELIQLTTNERAYAALYVLDDPSQMLAQGREILRRPATFKVRCVVTIALAETLTKTDQVDEAMRRLRTIIEELRSLEEGKSRKLLAEALNARGNALLECGRFSSAYESFSECSNLARIALKQDVPWVAVEYFRGNESLAKSRLRNLDVNARLQAGKSKCLSGDASTALDLTQSAIPDARRYGFDGLVKLAEGRLSIMESCRDTGRIEDCRHALEAAGRPRSGPDPDNEHS